MRLPSWLANLPEEVWFFLRIAAYAFFIGTVYWFLTYEAAGTMLLYGFGLAAGFSMMILGLAARGRHEARATADTAADGAASTDPNGPFGDESGRIPSPSIAPFAVGLGAAVLALGLVLGPWLILLGLLAAVLGAVEWLAAAQRELAAVEGTRRERATESAERPAEGGSTAASHQAVPR